MTSSRMPPEFYDSVKHLLPTPNPVGPNGGRPPISNEIVLKVIWFVMATGCRWADVPLEMGCCGETARTRLRDWEELGVWDQVHQEILRRLNEKGKLNHKKVVVDSGHVRAFGGGDLSGPSPVDRGKPGRKYSVLVDENGVMLGILISGGNVSDQQQLLPLVIIEFPHVTGKPGRPREKPEEVYADAGYSNAATCAILDWLDIEPHIRQKGTPHGSGLGKVRWVVERAIAWLKGLRRMRISYDRSDPILNAWKKLAMSVINFRMLTSEPAAT
jgi:transposase